MRKMCIRDSHGAVRKQAVDFRLPVAALAAQHDIGDALFAAHTLEGAASAATGSLKSTACLRTEMCIRDRSSIL